MERDLKPAFAVWLTGLPASGKSTLAAALNELLAARGLHAAVLESDALRPILTPHPRYDDEERDQFYRQVAFIGRLLVDHGVPVIFDATANRRAYRGRARAEIPRFFEVYVATPLAACIARDPKGIYRQGREGATGTIPGLQAPYEPPQNPELVVDGEREQPQAAARRVLSALLERNYL